MVSVVPGVVRVTWPNAFRIIRSIYPPIDLFEDIADPEDWELIASAEAKSNPRVRDQIGEIKLVPVGRRVRGPGASWVMAPFTHVSPNRPTRFSDGTYGVYYTGDRFAVALYETVYHFERFMGATSEPPMTANFRELVGGVDNDLHDLREDSRFEACLDEDDYSPGQELGRRLRSDHRSDGLVYPSVRYQKGEAITAFWPDVVDIPVQGRHLAYRWDGKRTDAYLVYGENNWQPL